MPGRPQSMPPGGRPPSPISSHDLERLLNGLRFPARTEQVVRAARGNAAPTGMMDLLRRLPAGARFEDVGHLAATLP